MAQFNLGTRVAQEKMAAGAAATADPTGQLIFLDTNKGNDGNDGSSPRHSVATLAHAISLAAAGDTIVCAPGGSETVTSTVTQSLARLKIICPTDHPARGYKLSGAGTLDLLTITGADTHVEGLVLAHTGATASASGVLVQANRATIKGCLFDDSAISATWTGNGVEIDGDVDDTRVEGCISLDCLYGVYCDSDAGEDIARTYIKDCTFFIGQAAAFGVGLEHASTGTISGVVIEGCTFMEADGDGTSATAAWDGSDNTNATQGTIYATANADQILVRDCKAYTALAQAFNTLGAVSASAASEFANNATGTGDDASAAVTSVGTLVSSALSATQSWGTAGSTAHSSSLSAAASVGVVTSTAASIATLASTSASTAASTAASWGVAGSTAHSSSLSAVVSYGVAGAAANSSSLSATVSWGVAGSTAHSSSLSAVASWGVAGSTAHSSSLSAVASWGVAGSTAHSSSLSAVASYGVAGSTANSSNLSAAVSLGTLVSTVVVAVQSGTTLTLVGSLADNAIDNNTQGAGNTLCTATGDFMVEEILLSKDATTLTGPTNLEISSNNTIGLTGVNAPHAVEAIGALQANENFAATGASGTPMVPFRLESTKKLYLHGDDSAGTSGGNTYFVIKGTALSAGGSIA